MRIIKNRITRREVIQFYSNYDREKKGQTLINDFDSWDWDTPDEIDKKLRENGLKHGVLAAYSCWQFVQLDFNDLKECAIVNHIFKEEKSQCIGNLIQTGCIQPSKPNGNPNWWDPISSGSSDIPEDWALILRPSVKREHPAKWYIEDGSGRATALVQRMLKHDEEFRTAFAYIGVIPDKQSEFIKKRPELMGC